MSLHKLFVSLSLLAPLACLATGCGFPLNTTWGPGINVPIPIPVSPFFQKQLEDRFRNKERYERVAILGPITSGGVPQALDPPTEAEVMAALPTVEGGLPFLDEVQRNNVRMTIELIADYIDPPRFYPIIGWAQLHHAHYKCTVYYTEINRVGWPFPHTTVDEEHSEVMYIDHNHFHMTGTADGGANTNYAQPRQ